MRHIYEQNFVSLATDSSTSTTGKHYNFRRKIFLKGVPLGKPRAFFRKKDERKQSAPKNHLNFWLVL